VYRPTFELLSFETISFEDKIAILERMLEALIYANLTYLRVRPDTPKLYDSGVIYVTEPEGQDEWQDIPTTLAKRSGDCEDLASYRVAELRMQGVKAMPYVTGAKKANGFTLFHIRVRYPDGRIEDPSALLGMPA